MSTRRYKVVGVSFENRQDILNEFYSKHYRTGMKCPVRLCREDDNAYDRNAVAVILDVGGHDEKVGYISKDENVGLRAVMPLVRECRLGSVGPNAKGVIGLNIEVDFKDAEDGNA